MLPAALEEELKFLDFTSKLLLSCLVDCFCLCILSLQLNLLFGILGRPGRLKLVYKPEAGWGCGLPEAPQDPAWLHWGTNTPGQDGFLSRFLNQ